MSSRSRSPVNRPVLIGYCLILACAAVAVLCAAAAPGAKAAYYKMVLCGADNGSNSFETRTNTTSSEHPGGIMSIENYCGPAPYPAGNHAWLRISENQAGGPAGNTAYGQVSWTVPSHVSIAAGGGYTRMPGDFRDGWRGRFWAEGYDGSTNNILMQGAGVENNSCGGVCWATTPNFGSHLWPFGAYGNYKRFVFELTCMRPAGCDRSGWNVVEANSFQLVLNDGTDPASHYTGSRPLQDGEWTRGDQTVSWMSADEGSGLHFERLRINGAERASIDRRGQCNIGWHPATGEFARDFVPCPRGGWWGSEAKVNTASLSDGTHSMAVCVQDYGQSQSGGETCNSRTIRTDNNAPAAPSALSVTTPNPARYLDTFGARWSLPPDAGSPILKVHYDVVDPAGKVVVPAKTVAATNPTQLAKIEGPKAAGDYRLRVWLEDQVGFIGPAATVPIPHDTTPPAAPQELSVASPDSSRQDQGFDLRWRNITDSGAPIDALHYQVLEAGGKVVVPTQDIGAQNPEVLANLETPKESGVYQVKLWLSDAEGNVGAPTEAPLSYDCVRSDVGDGQTLTAGVGDTLERLATVNQDQGAKISGSLAGSSGMVKGAALCMFSRVITDDNREFLGIAMTGSGGAFNFPLGAGPSREVSAIYRPDQRQITAKATVLTKIKPTLNLVKKVVRNKRKAIFYGEIPGPHNDNVTVVLQVEHGRGWRAFRRYKTRFGGKFKVAYRFTQTHRKTIYPIRAQVRRTVGLPYEPGDSRTVRVRVLP